MTLANRLHGLYVITDPVLCGDQLVEKVTAAIAGGAQIVQYRNKQASPKQQRQEATALAELCKQHTILFLINDDAALARDVDADGVHLGQQDTGLSHARALLGANKIIGVSCNNRFDYALDAQDAGADYVAFGRFFPSQTKPQAPQADPSLLERARNELHIPVCAIGGINLANATQLLAAGAQMLAVIHGIFAADDIKATTRRYADLFKI